MTPAEELAFWKPKIEAKHGFVLPREYCLLAERGALGPVAVPGSFYLDLIDTPYLWLNEMEWRGPKDLFEFEPPDYWIEGFISFAFNGGGDPWCLYPNGAVGGRIPVIQCPGDEYDAEFYAPDFISALYRQSLDFCRNDLEEHDRPWVRRWAREFGPLFPSPHWQKRLELLAERPLSQRGYGVLEKEEYKQILRDDLNYDRLGEIIPWMTPP